MKIKKFFTSLVAVVIMAVSVGALNVSASGTVKGTVSGSGTATKVTYSFDVDGNYYSRTNNGSHYGMTSSRGFVITTQKTYTVTFNGISTAATVYIYNESTDAKVASFTIPKYTSGMSTLYSGLNLSAGQYYVKVVSSSKTTYSTGSFYISGVAGTYTHS